MLQSICRWSRTDDIHVEQVKRNLGYPVIEFLWYEIWAVCLSPHRVDIRVQTEMQTWKWKWSRTFWKDTWWRSKECQDETQKLFFPLHWLLCTLLCSVPVNIGKCRPTFNQRWWSFAAETQWRGRGKFSMIDLYLIHQRSFYVFALRFW